MTDPISGKIASQMAEQASGVGEQSASVSQGDSSQKTSFKDVMANVQSQQVDEAKAADNVDAIEGVEGASESEGPAETRLQDFLDGLRTDETRLEKMMEGSLSGADMSNQELLEMQSLIYAYSQKVELASKAVSNAASGMKQIMNTQV
ncbi:hypothetical protein FIV42_22110 [Persicimonas caeni]|uniref:EscI/YscI/HrpB family type III secretion system inner rod protein n=1 Tax=Persicimonas caeni TaxID=2292766 RepID=A0A4Y6PYF1_PERCE|nr:hypothetical protein [Persicimonas caeni]QDG53341.1 hypothetical protein FIV42_22110 [Persicimonas caeni]QED34562.1 hypothetical protein FRD00_22105 [Persicimonas caeni]